ncbi:MAG: methionyl-tRNA formyltransferase [Sphingobacteriales bacterium]|nr:MAG: methionyl-tRNA formyltransferase [Sphingobacteriales bacterium]
MGTPPFAVASLKALMQASYNIVGVVTAPDKPAGRGQKINQSAVKIFATDNNLNVLQPEKLKHPDFLAQLKALNADVQIVVAFRMLPQVVWAMPAKGTINLHGSLLPQYRGAAPINWAIINGEKESGVTTFLLQQEIDTGNILFLEKVAITDNTTAGQLHDELMEIGATLIVKTVKAIETGNFEEQAQDIFDVKDLKHAPKIFKENCLINWDNTNTQVHNLIRGLSPFPTAFTHINEKVLKIFEAEKEDITPNILPGNYLTDGKTFLKFATNNGHILLKDVQLEGKKRMAITDFLRGIKL